jgi:Fe-S-cluster containining protein
MPLELDLDRIAALAEARRDDFEVLRYTLEFIQDELPDGALDALVEEIAAPILAAIDCTACAHCCATIDVYLTPTDADCLAEALALPVEVVIARYIERESAGRLDEWGVFRHSPCAFLEGKRCLHYSHRPEACRAYPALTPDFRWTLADTLAGAGRCPIIYHILEALARRFDR